MKVKIDKTSNEEFQKTIASFQNDLIAVFKSLEEDIYNLVAKGEREGWTPEMLINEIDSLI